MKHAFLLFEKCLPTLDFIFSAISLPNCASDKRTNRRLIQSISRIIPSSTYRTVLHIKRFWKHECRLLSVHFLASLIEHNIAELLVQYATSKGRHLTFSLSCEEPRSTCRRCFCQSANTANKKLIILLCTLGCTLYMYRISFDIFHLILYSFRVFCALYVLVFGSPFGLIRREISYFMIS